MRIRTADTLCEREFRTNSSDPQRSDAQGRPVAPYSSLSSQWLIVGAGPAGLTAAHEAVRHGITPLVIEQGDRVGGIARTEAVHPEVVGE